MATFPLSPLYAIVDADVAQAFGWTVPRLAHACLAGGVRWLQLRAKTVGSADLLALCREVLAEARAVGARLVLNDRADVAAAAGADGVHVGQDDLPVAEVRRAFPSLSIVGTSTHSRAQVDRALGERIDYLAVGPVFRTSTKDTGYDAVGLDLVRYAASSARARSGERSLPVVAIGGVTLDRAVTVLGAGAASVAVISDLLATGDPESRVRAYLARLGRP